MGWSQWLSLYGDGLHVQTRKPIRYMTPSSSAANIRAEDAESSFVLH